VTSCLSAVLLLASVACDSPAESAWLAAGSCLALMSQQSFWWSCAIEISGRHVGALFGLMNGIGVIGAMTSQFFFGAFADWRRSLGFEGREAQDPAFFVYAALLMVAAVCWLFVDTSRPVDAIGEPGVSAPGGTAM
jgi:hypothetical protein